MKMIRALTLMVAIALSPNLGLAQELAHIRFLAGEEQWQGELQTAVSLFSNAKDQHVYLVSAIHIGDRKYYEQLNLFFTELDALLFELVADNSALQASQQSTGGSSPLSLIQTMLANYLGLEFQLAAVDYGAENFRHADLTATELLDIMASKDESLFSMFLTMATAQMAAEREGIANNTIEPSALNLVTLINALSSENQSQALKFLLAEELARSGGLALNADVESGLTILGDRNTAALEVLQTTLEEGTQEIGLFYGAAHMPGLARALVQDFGFELESQRWIAAWSIP